MRWDQDYEVPRERVAELMRAAIALLSSIRLIILPRAHFTVLRAPA